MLNVPDELFARLTHDQFWEIYNKPFLDASIRRGDDIVLATKPTLDVLSRKLPDGSTVRTGLGREWDYMQWQGYRYDAATDSMKKGS